MSAATVILQPYKFQPGHADGSLAAAKRKMLAEARSGDGEAFAEMILPYAPGLYRRALRMTGNPADAEDARQEALLKAFSRLNQFAGQQDETKDDLHAWVSRITTNASIDLIRQRREGKYVSLEEPTISPEETLGTRLPARTDNPDLFEVRSNFLVHQERRGRHTSMFIGSRDDLLRPAASVHPGPARGLPVDPRPARPAQGHRRQSA